MPTQDLKFPITKGERTITTLVYPDRVSVRNLMAGDGCEFGSVKREFAILVSLTGESEIMLKEMDVTDWIASQVIVNSLITGESENKKSNESEQTQSKKNSENSDEQAMTFEEYIESIRRVVVETLNLVNGMSYDNVLDLSLDELFSWHKKGIEVYKSMHGIE